MINEASRHALFQKLEHVLGMKEATTLIEYLPPVGWADVATKEYVDFRLESTEQRLRAAIKDEVGALQVEIGGLKVEMAGLKLDVNDKIGALDVLDKMGGLHVEFGGQVGSLRDEITRQTRAIVLSGFGLMATVVLGLVGVVFAVVQLAAQ